MARSDDAPEHLLMHEPFVRGLARQLLRDPDRAADLAQQAMLSSLQRPPVAADGPGLRAFFTTLVRRLCGRQLRTDRRRAAREQQVAHERSVPQPTEILAREAQRTAVVHAVLGLEPHYRDVVVLRFFEQLPPRAIAARLSLPVETVRTRQKRALALLRERLDQRAGGRAAWVPLLSPFTGPPRPWWLPDPNLLPIASGVTLMHVLAKLAAATLVLGLVFVGYQMVAPPSEPPTPPTPPSPAAVAATTELQRDAAGAVASDVRSAATPSERASAGAAGPATGRLAVLVQHADHRPATGVVVWLRQRDADEDPMQREPRLVTGADGTVEFAALPPGRWAAIAFRGNSEWSDWIDVHAGAAATTTIRFDPGMDLRGIVVDGQGRPIGGAEIVVSDWGSATVQVLTSTAPDGTFALPGLYTHVHVGARAPAYAPSPQRQFTAAKGAQTEIRIVLDQPAASLSGVVCTADGTPIQGALVTVGDDEQKLTPLPDGGAAHGPRPLHARTDAAGAFTLVGLPTGSQPLSVTAMPHAPWSSPIELAAGRAHHQRIVLMPGASLQVDVVDAAGAPVPGTEVYVGRHEDLGYRRARTRGAGSVRFEGLVPGPVEVRAQHDQQGQTRTRLDLVAGRPDQWRAQLQAGSVVRLRVIDANGKPVRAHLEARREPAPGEDYAWFHGSTDPEGRVQFTNAPAAGELRVEVKAKSSFPELVATVVIGPDEQVLTLPDHAPVHIRGRVLGENGKPLANVAISPMLADAGTSPAETADAKTGAFALGPYPPGAYTLHVSSAGHTKWAETRTLAAGETWDLGELRLQPGAAVAVSPVVADQTLLTGAQFSIQPIDGGNATELGASKGRFVGGPLAPGRYWIRAHGERLAAAGVACELVGGRETAVELPLRAGITAVLQADGPTDAPPRTIVQFAVFDASGRRLGEPAAHLEHGRAEVRFGLAPGRYRVEVTGHDRTATGELLVEAGASHATGRWSLR